MADKRFLRTALLTSERWNNLTDDAQLFYVRLLLIVDDFGCYDGRPLVIQQAAYYLGRTVPVPLDLLHTAGLIVRYTNAGKTYIAITNWSEQMRGRRVFPAPPINNDQPDITYRGKYGNPIGWVNPAGSDEVSVLIDANLRPVTPQPREWRDPERGWEPLGAHTTFVKAPKAKPKAVTEVHDVVPVTGSTAGDQSLGNMGTQSLVVPSTVVPVPGSQRLVASPSPSPSQAPTPSPSQSPSPGVVPVTGVPVTATAAAATAATNGKIRLNSKGAWEGLDEAQRLRWQEMFADLSIPDQLDRAGAWLMAHPAEREAYERDGTCEAFLIRWLLREARPAPH